VPVLIIFALPFGSLMLPLLTEALDRRNRERAKQEALQEVDHE
jgi:NhaP-type Na+/H+ or K+/H+ antiporter